MMQKGMSLAKNETYSKDFEEYLKTVEILYVEDEEGIRTLLESRLQRHFGKVHSAQNGEVGLYKFETYRPKIVITDIRMPIMDGLEMLSIIKDKNPQVKAIVTTAHSDMEFMLKSIEIGIDKYIVKPINVEELMKSVKKICFQLYNEQLAIEFQRKSASEQLNGVMTNIFEQISQSIPNPMVLYSDSKPVFINKAFSNLFAAETIGLLHSGEKNIEEYLDVNDKQRVTIKLPSGRKKIFSLYKTAIHGNDSKEAMLYSLNDLTAYEYQNAKLKSYADVLYELLKVRHSYVAKPLSENTADEMVDKESQARNDDCISASIMLGSQEMDALKRSHTSKIAAIEYIKEVTQDVLEELDELKELEMEIGDIIDTMNEDGNFNTHIPELGTKFSAYSRSIGKLIDFEDLAIAVRNFGEFLSGLSSKQYTATKNQYTKKVIYLHKC